MSVKTTDLGDLEQYLASLPDEERERLAEAAAALDVAQLLFSARDHRGLTQKQAEELTGVKQQEISRYEGGVGNITIKKLERYLRKLGFTLEIALLDDETGQIVERIAVNRDRPRPTEPARKRA
ncbi:MAG TPA: helix-turn-helix transcriptional regulator [Thermomicrobiaceae bacterium]|nr:helix-turn-helix transcriptional regulator [Thermomicrobiaceae bacterium]